LVSNIPNEINAQVLIEWPFSLSSYLHQMVTCMARTFNQTFLRTFLLLGMVALASRHASAQGPADYTHRTTLEPEYAPFYHGVASGDPLTDRVILWTRVTHDTLDPVTVTWKIALDTNLTAVVNSGSATTDASKDWTVKVDVAGLSPDTWYYYRFDFLGRKSLVGRTKTAPAAGNDSLRLAIVSCSDYEEGYFNAYERLTTRNDVDAVVHLGDYIYEGGAGTGDRIHEPDHEILSLEDYRIRLSQHHLDPHLRYAHQQLPWIVIWDDHETANNAWIGGAEQHDPGTEGPWADRVDHAMQAYFEWMPIRQPDSTDAQRGYRTLTFGDLADLIVTDSRLEGRMEQVTALDPSLSDSARTMLGTPQFDWVKSELLDSTTQWKILGNQVMMAPLVIFGLPVNTDQWDGYPAERTRLYKHVLDNNIDNFVVITGDIHCSWANDLPGPYGSYDPSTGANSAGVEFVVTSVTSANADITFGEALIQLANPHIKYTDLAQHGYLILDVNHTRTQGDYYFVSTIASADTNESWDAGWYVLDGERWLHEATAPSPGPLVEQPLAPLSPGNPFIGVNDPQTPPVLFGAYPNPVTESMIAEFYLFREEEVVITLRDLAGREIWTTGARQYGAGLHFAAVETGGQAAGAYLVELRAGDRISFKKLIKE
jgi:alkaline phosphatase D